MQEEDGRGCCIRQFESSRNVGDRDCMTISISVSISVTSFAIVLPSLPYQCHCRPVHASHQDMWSSFLPILQVELSNARVFRTTNFLADL